MAFSNEITKHGWYESWYAFCVLFDMSQLLYILRKIEQVNTVIGIILNVILLVAIRKFSGTHLGTYKHLLTIFAISDIFLSILQAVVQTTTMVTGCTHGTVTDTILDDRRVTALDIAFQSVPFILLAIHFLYRYWSVRHPHRIAFFSSKLFVLFLISMTVGVINSWYTMCIYGTAGKDDSLGRRAVIAEYARKYGKRIEHAWIVLDHWRDNRINVTLTITIIFLNIIMISSIILASSLAYLTFHHIQQSTKISTQAKRLQKKLLIALCAQASVPCLFVYISYLLGMNIPFWRIPITFVHDISIPLTTCFPVLDAAVVIILITDYRQGLMGLIRKPQAQLESELQSSMFLASTNVSVIA